MVYYVLSFVIALVIVYILIIFNKFISLKNKVKEGFSTMDVYLKKRWDLIPNLIEVVKGFADHEKSTFESIVNLRNVAYADMSRGDKIAANEEITTSISKLMMLAESYPELKANENFLNLSKELTQNENDIANSRKYYNAVVRMFNDKVEMFPSNLVALLFGYKLEKMFEASSMERENVKVEL